MKAKQMKRKEPSTAKDADRSVDKIPLIRRVVLSGATFTALLGVLGLLRVIPAIPVVAGYGLIAFGAIEAVIWLVVIEPMMKRKG